MAKPLPFNLYNSLHNFLGMYTARAEDVLVTEAISNALDAKAKNVEINFYHKDDCYYIEFINDAPGMSRQEFIDYHTVSLSSKTKGEGIGFAGVGAKIYLGSSDGEEIITITKKDKKSEIFASRMYQNLNNIEYISSIEEPLESVIGIDSKANDLVGTKYKVKLLHKNYFYLKDRIKKILPKYFSQAIKLGMLKIFVDGFEIEPIIPNGEEEFKEVNFKKQKIKLFFYNSENYIDEENRYIIITVYGKRIKNITVDFVPEIIDGKQKKVSCSADVPHLAKYLTSNKEDIQKNKETHDILSKINTEFRKFLKAKGLFKEDEKNNSDLQNINNETIKKLEKLLQDNKFRFLNPWSKPDTRNMPVLDSNGDVVIEEISEVQTVRSSGGDVITERVGGDIEGTTTDKRADTIGGGTGIGYTKDEEGNRLGTEVKTKARGLNVIPVRLPQDPREGWINLENKGVVFNEEHPLAKKCKLKSRTLEDYNRIRVVISELIKYSNDKKPMDSKEGLKVFEEVFRLIWL